jgi:hypothetical protein
MKSQAPKVMNELCDKNLVSKMWVTINNNTLLTKWLSEFLKLAKIVMVSILGSVEDECTFSMLTFMKNRLHNRLDNGSNVCTKFYTQESFLYQDVITTWKNWKLDQCYHLKCLVFFCLIVSISTI